MLSTNWKKKSFGLDISGGKFRIVQLRKTGNKIKLVSYNKIDIPEGIVVDGKIIQTDKAIEYLHQLLHNVKGKRISTKFVNACLPESQTFIKLININKAEGETVLDKIISEAKKHIPYSLEEVYLDWQYGQNKEHILIGVCPKEIVENYQDFLIKAGFLPVSLEIEAVAIARSLLPIKEKFQESLMILDLGAKRTGLILCQDDMILFTLSIPVSGQQFTKLISEKLKIDFKQAEEAKRYCGLEKDKADGAIYSILEENFKKITQKVREAKYFYHEHFYGQKSLDKLLITGGGSEILGVQEFLSQETGMEVIKSNCLTNLAQVSLKLPKEDLASYSTAIGLALRNLFNPK